jgi:hypothetical protein
MLHWLHSLLPHLPHYGYVLVFIVVFLNNIGVPLPGETILLGAGFILGKAAGSLWEPMGLAVRDENEESQLAQARILRVPRPAPSRACVQ